MNDHPYLLVIIKQKASTSPLDARVLELLPSATRAAEHFSETPSDLWQSNITRLKRPLGSLETREQ